MKKKILSLILALAMVLPLCPVFDVPAFAEGVVSALTSEENKGEEDQSELKIETIPQTSQLATASTSKIVLGTDGKITRAEWLHNLVYVFNMTAEATALPDNYFSDLDNSHKYYGDILLAVEFGVVDVEAGGLLAPDAFVTREYAASTLNFCLGYQLGEEESYTFSDSADCEDPVSAQIALNRGWFELADGKFSPAILVTEEEVEMMLDDAASVLEKQVVDTGYDNTYEFVDGVIVVPSTVIATEDENGVVSIIDCPETIAANDKFAVYYNGIPVVYTAKSVTVKDNVTVIETEEVETEEVFTEVDAQGVISAEDIEIVPADGVEMEIEEENISTFSSRATKKIKNISFKKPIKITKDITANFSVKINNPYVEYIVETEYAYVAINGETTVEYGATFDAVSFAGIESSIPIFTANIGGVGSFDVTVEYDFSGSVKGTVEGYLIAGLECSKNDGLRAVKYFSQSDYYTTVDATADVSLKASLGITKMPIIKGYVYARVGARSNFNLVDYSSGTPDQCVSFSGYLYAKYGASASAKIGSWSKTFSKDFDIYTKSNSPVRIEHHYEDDVPVASCTRGSSTGSGSGSKYYTKSNSKWSGSGWSGADSAYGLGASGTRVALYEYSLDEKNNATITKYKGNSSYVSVPETIDGYTVTGIGSAVFSEHTNLIGLTLPDTIVNIGAVAFAETAITSIHIPKSLDNCLTTYSNYGYTLNGVNYAVLTGPFVLCDNLKNVTFETGMTQIPQNLLAGCTGIESITIPDSVAVIEWSAFEDCIRLKDVNIGNSVTEIGSSAFEQCISLEEIIIPNSVTTVESSAFRDCFLLKELVLPNKLKYVDNYLFYNCYSLEKITLPEGINMVGTSAFSGCTALESIQFPVGSALTEIGSNAFYNCAALKEINLLDKTKTVGSSAFENCTSLEKVTMPQSLQTLGSSAFMGCEALKDVSIADYSLKTINSYTFKDCPSLVSFTLPKGLTTVGSQAFMNDTALVNVTIPESVTSIDSTAFSYPAKTTIYGKKGSYAESFANEGGFTFAERYIPLEGMLLKGDSEEIILDQGETHFAEFEIFPEDSTEVITLAASNSNVTIDGHKLYGRYAGDTVITASTQSGLTYEFSIHVRSVKSIQITSLPTKTSYLMGEEFDKTGMVVQVNYNDGTSKTVEDYTVTGFDSSKEGTVTLTVKWVSAYGSTYSKTFSVEIIDPTPKLTGIFVETLPTKISYNLREKLDTTGMVVKGTYTDGSTKEITDFTLSGYNALKTGRHTITVKCGDFSTSFVVTVGITVTEISIESAPFKTEYDLGESLELDGLSLKLTYSDGVTETVTAGFTISGFDSATEGEKMVMVSYGALSDTFTVAVKCSHTGKALIPEKLADCKEGGWDAYYTCDNCGKLLAKDGITVLLGIPTTDRNPDNHIYDNTNDLICNLCGFERPPYTPGDVDGEEGITLNDAIYLLYHVNFPSNYPVDQPVDFDGSGKVDLNDAIYLLYHVNFPASYPLH